MDFVVQLSFRLHASSKNHPNLEKITDLDERNPIDSSKIKEIFHFG